MPLKKNKGRSTLQRALAGEVDGATKVLLLQLFGGLDEQEEDEEDFVAVPRGTSTAAQEQPVVEDFNFADPSRAPSIGAFGSDVGAGPGRFNATAPDPLQELMKLIAGLR